MERIRNAVTNTYQSIAEWIAGQGGWAAALDSISNGINMTHVAVIASVLGFIGFALWYRSRH